MARVLAGRPDLGGGCRAVERGAKGAGRGSAAGRTGGGRGRRGGERGATAVQFPPPGGRFSRRSAPPPRGCGGRTAHPAPPRRSGIRPMGVGARSRPSERPAAANSPRCVATPPLMSSNLTTPQKAESMNSWNRKQNSAGTPSWVTRQTWCEMASRSGIVARTGVMPRRAVWCWLPNNG
jgi:hypothetical protein